MRKKFGPLDLTGPNAALLLQEEREETLREKNRFDEDESRRDWNESQRAIDAGHTLTDFRGKRIRGRGSNPLIAAIYPYSAGRTVADDFIQQAAVSMAWGQFFLSIQEYYARSAEAWAAAMAPAKKPVPETKPHYEDNEFEYEEIFVSHPVYERLMKQQYEINDLSYMIAASTDPWEENKLRDDRSEKLGLYDMRRLPDRSGYVHCQSRVEEMEDALNPDGVIQQTMSVLVYRPKLHSHDGLRIYSKVGDAFNDNPVEAIATGDHLKVEIPARPIPPPAYNFDA